jgi:hypothetical protein
MNCDCCHKTDLRRVMGLDRGLEKMRDVKISRLGYPSAAQPATASGLLISPNPQRPALARIGQAPGFRVG